MRIARLIGLAVLLTGALFILFAQDDEIIEEKYVRVRRPLPNIYEQLDPKSPIIRQGKRGEYLDVLSEGESWLKVRVVVNRAGKDDTLVGYMEARHGDVVTKKSNPAAVMFMIVIVLMIGCAGCVVLFIKKQQQVAAAEEPI